MSRLNTTGGDQRQEHVDVDVPVLASGADGNEDADYWNPYVDDANERVITEQMTPTDPPQPIPEIELINEQRKDTMCQQISLTAGTPKSQFHFDNRGMLVRVSPLDGVSQKVRRKSFPCRCEKDSQNCHTLRYLKVILVKPGFIRQ